MGIIANEQGSTLGELRNYFARTPDTRIVINDATWRAVVANGVANDALHVMTPSGEVNPAGYDPNWQVWVKGYEPQPETGGNKSNNGTTSGGTEIGGTSSGNHSGGLISRQTTFTSGKMSGRAAYEAVKRFMADNDHDWPALASCQVKGTSPTLADQIASIAQGDDGGIAITLRAQNQRLQVGIQNRATQRVQGLLRTGQANDEQGRRQRGRRERATGTRRCSARAGKAEQPGRRQH